MQRLSLIRSSGHLFAILGNERWLLDTGSPKSFGQARFIDLDGTRFEFAAGLLGIDRVDLSRLVGEQVSGLLGMDVLGQIDLEIDCPAGYLGVSREPLDLVGADIAIDHVMSIPVLEASVGRGQHRMFFDTGAPVSYFQHESLGRFDAAGELDDFFPGFGHFRTDTHLVPFRVGPLSFELRCGRLPDTLGAILALAGVEGIIGNEICAARKVGYSARRNRIYLS